MGDSMRLVDRDIPRAASLGELVTEAAFAGSRLGDNADDLRVSGNRSLQRGLQGHDLATASDKFRETASTRHIEAGPHRAHALEFVDPKPITHTFDLERSEIA